MFFKKYLWLFIISGGLNQVAFSQETPANIDSVRLYENIETLSNKSAFYKAIYNSIFKSPESSAIIKKSKKRVSGKPLRKPYSAFEGKIIRHINVQTLDPFGFSIKDTSSSLSLNFFTETGNKLHVKSQDITIRNLLLIRQNQPFDSLKVKESERLVRSSAYISDVSFFAVLTARNSDSVDIFIRTLDRWSIIPKAGLSTSLVHINLADKNFLGLGHDFRNNFAYYPSSQHLAYNTTYLIPNIRNTYINSSLHYGTDEFGNFSKNFAVNRTFFSPLAKWAAGLDLSQHFRRDSLMRYDSLFAEQRYRYNTQDYWAGNAFQLFSGNSEYHRTTNFISAIRFLRVRYLESPTEIFDAAHKFSDENFYLASIGVSSRRYVEDKYIFKYGISEDVPVGKVFSLTGGYQLKNNSGRIYLGGRMSLGKYYQWGYLGSNFEYGTFFHKSKTEQGTFLAGANFYTGLFEIGKWKFRQFAKSQITVGVNRFSNDSISLNEGYGLDGFKNTGLSGSSRLILSVQTQSYCPWDFVGFRFGPYLNASVGMLGTETNGFRNSSAYSQIGLGVLIKNENLIINTFQVSIAFYPIIPGSGKNIFKFNSFRAADFGFRDFEIDRPGIVVFQ